MALEPLVPQQVIVSPDGDVVPIVGSDLAGRYPHQYAAPRPTDLLGYARGECPVCGHPTGDCVLHEG